MSSRSPERGNFCSTIISRWWSGGNSLLLWWQLKPMLQSNCNQDKEVQKLLDASNYQMLRVVIMDIVDSSKHQSCKIHNNLNIPTVCAAIITRSCITNCSWLLTIHKDMHNMSRTNGEAIWQFSIIWELCWLINEMQVSNLTNPV